MKFRGRRLFVSATCLAAALTAVPSLGYPDESPTVILRVGERAQAGVMGSFYRWTGPVPVEGAPTGQGCGQSHGDAFFPAYPSPRQVATGDLAVSTEFHTAEAPTEVSIRGWTKVEEDGARRGPRAFASSLRPLEEEGNVVAWVADSTVRVRKHLYLDVYAEWAPQDEPEGCPKGLQSAFWHFHLKTGRA
ncbi:MAG: hypothetical protein ACRDHM_04080 [Actinomycetota bacterium]